MNAESDLERDRRRPMNLGEGFQPMRPCLDGCGTKVDAADGLCETCRRIRSGSCRWDLTRSSSGTLVTQVRCGRPEDPYTQAATAELERRAANAKAEAEAKTAVRVTREFYDSLGKAFGL